MKKHLLTDVLRNDFKVGNSLFSHGHILGVGLLAVLSGFLCPTTGYAQDGQPHSVKAVANYSDVTLSWKKPAEQIALQWHNGVAYNGRDGIQSDPEGMNVIYTGAKFTPADLKNYAGQTVDSIAYYEYRDAYKVSVLIYEDGKVVREQPVNVTDFKKDSWRKVALDEPYKLPKDKNVMFSVRFEAGTNLDFVAICDREATRGKGNLYSYDGRNWKSDAPGDFLVTAILQNNATQDPDGYNVYRDGTKANAEAITNTEYTLKGEADGTHTYNISAVYSDGEKKSYDVTASTVSIMKAVPPVSSLSATVSELTDTLKWTAPLAGGSEMTWCNSQPGRSIGGTSTSSPKVWIKQEFSSEDLAAFPNHKITALKAFVGEEGGITGVTAFVMRNDTIVYNEALTDEQVAAIQPGNWFTVTLKEPYVMTAGNSYAYGFYYTHTAKKHPVGVDNGIAVEEKGNSFSTSSPSSKGFEKSKPSWKTLSSGNLSGNFLLKAEVEALSSDVTEKKIAGYDIYRDGEKIASDVAGTSYTDQVTDLGTYSYSVVAKTSDGKESPAQSTYVTINLPEEYAAPVVVDYDQTGKDVSFSWSTDAKELKHYGKAAVLTGFQDETPLIWGAKFSKEDLADYAGYSIKQLKFGIGEALDGFKIEVYSSDKQKLFSREYAKGDIEPGYLYSSTVDDSEAPKIPAGQDLYIVYNATLPAGSKAMILDNGPAVDGGAVVSFTSGQSWMNLGNVAPTLKDYNVVISALAVAPETSGKQAARKAENAEIELKSTPLGSQIIKTLTVKADKEAEKEVSDYGIEPDVKSAVAPFKAVAKPKAKSFRVYRNNQLVSDGAATTYNETLNEYGIYEYYVTAVYENGWESAASKTLTFSNLIAQKTQAPYDLQGVKDGENLKLTWSAPDAAPELSYQLGEKDNVLGMTKSSGNLEGYQVIKFAAGELADKAGKEVSHIKFKLADTNLLSASVVVLNGDNIIYEQPVEVSDLVKGWNNIRLNKPVKIDGNRDLSLGYHISYESGVKPLVCDEGPAVAGFGDLISSSGTPGYWYSLKTKFKQDMNWRISAVLQTPDAELKARAAAADEPALTYTVYRDGAVVESGITATELTVENAVQGKYTVTAVTADGESAESNAVVYGEVSGISSTKETLKTDNGMIYSADGRIVSRSGKVGNLKKGLYIMNGKKIIVK